MNYIPLPTAAPPTAWMTVGVTCARTALCSPSPIYPLVWPFVNGRARVIVDRMMVYIDTSGRILYPGRFLDMRDYEEGLAPVQVYRQE